jgi:hypothetical protein
MDQLQATPPHSRLHGVIIGLLFVILLGTLAVVGLLVTQPKPQAVGVDAEACEKYVVAAEEESENACEQLREQDREARIGNVAAHEGIVGFDYPPGWSVTTTTSPAERVTWRASLVPGYFTLCNECDGPFVDISMQVGSMTDPAVVSAATFHDYLLTIYTASNGFSDVEITRATDSGKRYTVTGKLTGLYDGTFETIYHEGTNLWASAFYLDRDAAETATNEDWELVKGSLNFSGIK